MLTRAELRSALDALEAGLAAQSIPSSPSLDEIASAATHWATQTRETAPLKRLARLCRTMGNSAAAVGQLRAAIAIDPNDRWLMMGLSAAFDDLGQVQQSLAVIEPLLAAASPDPAVLARGSYLARKLGDSERSIQYRRQAARLDRKQLSALLMDLTTAERSEEALAEARVALENGVDGDPELAFRCYVAIGRYSRNAPELAAALGAFEHATMNSPDGAIWQARNHRRENRFEEAMAIIQSVLRAQPDNGVLRRELAWCALAHGHWGRDAKILLDAIPYSGAATELRNGIGDVDRMLRAFGGSLEEAAANDAFASIRSPESVFDFVVDTPRAGDEKRQGIVMIASSLAAGGAERVLATCFNRIKDDARFGWAKLYVLDLSAETGKDFYLPLTGISRADVTILDRDCEVEAPLSWLGVGRGRTAQCILNQLRIDKPAIVHAWLEPLDALAGIASLLAGVQRIILHTHNMRPAELNPEDTFIPRLRGCYRALLRRPEVSLVCCADAGVTDYVDWIGLPDSSKVLAVHNGFNADDIARAGDAETTARLRATRGYTSDNIVIGTAFRFSAVKRPLRWVEAAEIILKRRPECRFLMFGDGELRAATQEAIAAKNLAPYFILPGLMSDLYRRLPVMDLFMLSSRTEALPNVLLEAQAAGVPVVAYDVGGVSETMIDGVSGMLVKEDTAEALAGAVLRALEDPAWLKRAGKMGQAFVRREFSVEKMITTLSEILLVEPANSNVAEPPKSAHA